MKVASWHPRPVTRYSVIKHRSSNRQQYPTCNSLNPSCRFRNTIIVIINSHNQFDCIAINDIKVERTWGHFDEAKGSTIRRVPTSWSSFQIWGVCREARCSAYSQQRGRWAGRSSPPPPKAFSAAHEGQCLPPGEPLPRGWHRRRDGWWDRIDIISCRSICQPYLSACSANTPVLAKLQNNWKDCHLTWFSDFSLTDFSLSMFWYFLWKIGSVAMTRRTNNYRLRVYFNILL